jgi:argininosuccinate synthase
MKLYKGNMILSALDSPHSLYCDELASFGESDYDQKDSQGFINLFGLPSKVASQAGRPF